MVRGSDLKNKLNLLIAALIDWIGVDWDVQGTALAIKRFQCAAILTVLKHGLFREAHIHQ